MRGLRKHIFTGLAAYFLLGCADVGEVPRNVKSDTTSTKGSSSSGDASSTGSSPTQPTTIPVPTETSTPAIKWLSGANGVIPQNGIPMGGVGGNSVFVCRATVGSAVLLGPIAPGGPCVVSNNGYILSATQYEVLSLVGGWDANIVLVDVFATPGEVPARALAGGHELNFETYVCRVVVGETVFVGKTRAGYSGCLYYNGYAEEISTSYTVLVLR